MSIFKRAANGSVGFSAGKHAGKTLEEVARLDPKYLRWARRDMALWAPDDIAQAVDTAMISNGIPFSIRHKKKT
jgi:hypothetical protein